MNAKLATLCASALASAALNAATPSVSLPPFVISGRVVDYEGAGLSSAEVRVRKNGTLLARSNVCRFESDTSANYAVAVPMSNNDIPAAAMTNDLLTLEVDTGDKTYSATNVTINAANPGRTLKLNIQAANCTNPYGVADKYLLLLREYVYAMGEDGFFGPNGEYLPDADYDHDGVSNYDEYLAGTDPLWDGDAGLRILSFKPVDGNDEVMEATFLPGRNRAYSAERADTSDDGLAFEPRQHQQEKAKGAPAKNYLITGNEDPEVRAIYLYKEGDSSLYRLRLE